MSAASNVVRLPTAARRPVEQPPAAAMAARRAQPWPPKQADVGRAPQPASLLIGVALFAAADRAWQARALDMAKIIDQSRPDAETRIALGLLEALIEGGVS